MGERTWDDCLVADNQCTRGRGGGRKEKLRRRRKRVLSVQCAVSCVSSGGYSERVSIGGLLRRNVLGGENPSVCQS